MVRSVALFAALALTPLASAQAGDLRVVGGSPVADGDWADTAGIVLDGYVGCTGTLIAPDLVLTAAHCLSGARVDGVVLGRSNYRNSSQGEVIGAAAHYSVDNWWSTYDAAVIVLEHESSYEPRPIAQDCMVDEYLHNGAPVAIVGYGAINEQGTQHTSDLMEGFTVVTDYDCTQSGGSCNSAVSPGGELGAGGDGVDACYGDSGGPLYLQTELGDFLIGITARAYNWVNVPCRDGGIYVRADAVVPWVEQVTGRTIPLSTCNLPPEPAARDDELVVPQNRSRRTLIQANDPDQSDGHLFEVLEPGVLGEVEIDDNGRVTYTAHDEVGEDVVVLGVSDTEGFPTYTEEVVLYIDVVERGFLGCQTVPAAPAAGWVVGLLGLLGLRRRRT